MKLIKKYWVLIITILLSLIPLTWFLNRSGYLINGVDTNFPLSPDLWFYRRLFVWNPINNAGSDFSASTAGLFFHLIQFIPYELGLNLQIVEISSLIFWFSAILFGSYLFIKSTFKDEPFIQIIFICFYGFNTYIFNTWENVKVANLSLVAAIPFGLAALNSAKESKTSNFLILTIITSLLVAGSGINPAYFIAFSITIFVAFLSDLLVDMSSYKKLLKIYSLFFLIIILSNSYWIFSSINFILNSISSSGSIQNLGFNNWLDSLSENTSILNIIRVQGAWDWYALDQVTGQPLYLSYTLNYFYRIPFIIYSFLIPILAVLGLIFRNKKFNNLYIFSGVLVILGIFLGVGSHLPTGSAYKFLSNNLPFFSLFRSPWYIFTPLLIIGYAILISLFFHKVKLGISQNYIFVIFWKSLILIILVGNLLYCYPLITGKVFRTNQSDSFFVKFPDYVIETKNKLDGGDGRILSYPPDEIENFSWGYRGVESILQLVIDRELIYSSLNYSDSMTNFLIKEFYKSLENNQLFLAHRLGQNLNISKIFLKNDQLSLASVLPKEVLSLSNQKFGAWTFYKFIDEKDIQKIKVYNKAILVSPFSSDFVWNLGLINEDEVLINAKDSLVNENEIRNMSYGEIYSALSSQSIASRIAKDNQNKTAQGYSNIDLSSVSYDFDILQDGYYSIKIENFRISDFGLNQTGSWVIHIDNENKELFIENRNDSFLTFSPIFLKAGRHELSIPLENKNLIKNSDFSKAINQSGFIYRDTKEGYLIVNNNFKKEVAFVYELTEFDHNSTYLIKTNYLFNYGEKPRLIAYQTNNKSPLKRDGYTLASLRDWSQYSFYFEPVRTKSILSIQLILPPVFDPVENPTGSKSSFDNLEVYKVFTNKLSLVKRDPVLTGNTKIDYNKISNVEYSGQVTNGQKPHSLVLLENFSPFWDLSLFTEYGEPVEYIPPHFTANFYANGWYIDGMPEKYFFKLYYRPQRYFIYGGLISIFTLLTIIVYVIKNYVKNKK